MAEQYCFLGWLHHILWPFILPTLKQRGTVEVHCSCLLFKPRSASPEAVPLNNGKRNRSLGFSRGTCSMQHCINAITIISEWRERQNVQLKLCLVQFLTEFTAQERCQIEVSGKHSPLFNRSGGKEWEQPCKPPPRLPPHLSSAHRCPSPYAGSPVLLGGRKSAYSHLFTARSPDTSVHVRPCMFMMGPSNSSKLSWKVPTSPCEKQKRLLPLWTLPSPRRAARRAGGAAAGQREPAAALQDLCVLGDSGPAWGCFRSGSSQRAGQVRVTALARGLDSRESPRWRGRSQVKREVKGVRGWVHGQAWAELRGSAGGGEARVSQLRWAPEWGGEPQRGLPPLALTQLLPAAPSQVTQPPSSLDKASPQEGQSLPSQAYGPASRIQARRGSFTCALLVFGERMLLLAHGSAPGERFLSFAM